VTGRHGTMLVVALTPAERDLLVRCVEERVKRATQPESDLLTMLRNALEEGDLAALGESEEKD
jgi:hypothetical protein